MSQQTQKSAGDLFGGHAQLYADARPTYPPELYEFVTGLCEKRESVWDCATGTGQAAVPLAERFKHVHATDINEDQVKVASNRKNIQYSVQASEQTSFSDEIFDLLTVAQALHWFDYSRFWHEVNRVLKPKGVFAAWGYDWTKIDFDVDFLLQENYFQPLKSYWNPKAQILWRGYQANEVRFPFQQIETPDFSIELDWDLNQLFQYFLSWSATQSYIKKNGTHLLETAKLQVKRVWGDDTETKLIRMPIHLLVGVKD